MAQWERFLEVAREVARSSPDPSTRNGAVLVAATGEVVIGGYNRFPRGVSDSEYRWLRPVKYQFVEHAERNAIYAAARHGVKTDGLVMVCPWAACADCARAIIEAGITKLVRSELEPSDWSDSIEVGDRMLAEAGVPVVTIPGDGR